MRCPICGGEGVRNPYGIGEWRCYCTWPGSGLMFWRPPIPGTQQHDPTLERMRRHCINYGFGWSWFTPGHPPVINRGED